MVRLRVELALVSRFRRAVRSRAQFVQVASSPPLGHYEHKMTLPESKSLEQRAMLDRYRER